MLPTIRRVGVVLPNGPAYFTRVFAGIGAYCRGRHHWRFVAWPTFMDPLKAMEAALAREQVDGVIGQASTMWEEMVTTRGLAFVNAEHSRIPFPNLPRVGLDEVAIANLASAHFRDRGLAHVAAVGQLESLPSHERLTAFVEAVRGWCPSPVHTHVTPLNPLGSAERLETWLRTLPRPVGIFCWNDESAKDVHQQCLTMGLRIPEDVALLGVDNDDTICHFLDPELSSIDPNAQRLGYEAAALLDRLMDGQPPPDKPILVPPIGVVTRASSEILAIDAPDVVRAMQFIRDHASAALTVEDVLDHLAVSRRWLETQFKKVLGRSPRSEIHRVLVERAKDLLANTDLTIPAIAERCGYKRSNHFTTMFRKRTTQTPTAYRRQTRLMG